MLDVFADYYIVTFKDNESAATTLATKDHIILGEQIQFHAIIDEKNLNLAGEYQKENLLAPDAKSPQNILNKLNDDNFKEIFKYLSLRDLCAVSSVCKQF